MTEKWLRPGEDCRFFSVTVIEAKAGAPSADENQCFREQPHKVAGDDSLLSTFTSPFDGPARLPP